MQQFYTSQILCISVVNLEDFSFFFVRSQLSLLVEASKDVPRISFFFGMQFERTSFFVISPLTLIAEASKDVQEYIFFFCFFGMQFERTSFFVTSQLTLIAEASFSFFRFWNAKSRHIQMDYQVPSAAECSKEKLKPEIETCLLTDQAIHGKSIRLMG